MAAPMNVLILSSRPSIDAMVLTLLDQHSIRPRLFRVSSYAELRNLLPYTRCDTLVVDIRVAGYGREFDESSLRRQNPGLPIITLDAAELPTVPEGNSTDRLLRAMRLIAPQTEMITCAVPAAKAPAMADLTGRQREVLFLLRQGCTTREIAAALAVAVPTVKSHLRALYRQLGASNRVEAVIKAPRGNLYLVPSGN
jgi:DNA-binding NarL/FixJ family response regulator